MGGLIVKDRLFSPAAGTAQAVIMTDGEEA